MDGVFLNEGEDVETLKRQIIEAYLYAKTAGGMFSMLVHPGNLDPAEMPELASFYRSFLPRCRLDNARSMTGAEIASWWHAREEVLRSVEFMPDLWRIRNVEIPPSMEFSISAPDIKGMKFAIEGVHGSSSLSNNTLRIRPGAVDPSRGIAILRRS